jgi:predicted amidohydrolase YtcJ
MKLFTNGVIHTMDPATPHAEALLVGDDGRIAAVGSRHELELPGATLVDLGGHTLIPGFNDAHVHVGWLGLLLTRLVDCRAHVAPTIPAIIERLTARAQSQAEGSWVQGQGYNEALLVEGRHLNRADLDQASQRHPMVVTRTCGHVAVANSLALALAGITAQTPDPPGGVIVRDEQGEPTGVLQETAMTLVSRLIPEPGHHQRHRPSAHARAGGGLSSVGRPGRVGGADQPVAQHPRGCADQSAARKICG